MAGNEESKQEISAIASDIDAVKFIEQRREMLQRISNLVNAVQRLTNSLDILLSTSGTNSKLADKTFGFMDYLDDKQKQLSAEKIEVRLEALDNAVRDQLSKILSSLHDKTGIDRAMTDEADEDVRDPLEVVTEFRRKVRLSMAYRLLMLERGADVEPINLDVAPELIQSCMKQLEHQEAFYKAKLLDEMYEFHQQVQGLLANTDLSERLKAGLQKAAKQLNGGMEFIRSNKPLDVLPFILDVPELTDVKDSDGATIVEAVDSADAVADEVKAVDKTSTKGFFKTLNTWLSTPSDVSWKDAKKK